ncbi:hypothetical protein COU57_02765 [Candidatus Pacearchaeota archaeon CG10_big_fil_rev_8_21_14_0_10_32_14]|nr:MAG: hypothetical protein COU57_02765 [Candidatus Pacearchaeota archaeon CG10_big_fil_rev_8_21_14_0_10_32_14]
MNILIINICSEPLHYYEFVKPIESIISSTNINYSTKDYDKLSISDIEKSDKIIISGTSIKDNKFLEDLHLFVEILKTNKPVFGICGGMEILGALLGGTMKERKEIGFNEIKFTKSFLNIQSGTQLQVYQLHNLYIDFSDLLNDIDISAKSYDLVTQAFKHKFKPMYGVLFHPEVRNENIIKEFIQAT